MAAAGEALSRDLTQAELAADAADLFSLPLAFAQHELISCRRITPRAVGIKLHLATGSAAPTRQRFYRCGRTGMLDIECLTLEAVHALAGFSVHTFARHGHLSLNWITGSASRKVILM